MAASDLTPEERRLAAAIDAMEKRRALAKTEGDIVTDAEITNWFREHAAVIRPLRDKLEGDW
ncbi:hypothetical protein CcrColossus_gp225 [Caulobacter phage CcrColossus]|uniref:Uncharacterized protein n=1 Tax=Caulobacter phage CcrColossus TaxID=1211640 RepID=K4JUR6_9CAUD|nr:hypothetical protein CcrColossus_gp225 [Caulobacter phage CcrColossus]AFU88095.1 hypothetical protein CcrColossus_gp225 [Caulobacter phage CcrColossus]